MLSKLSTKAETKDVAALGGRGIFAREFIRAGEWIATWGGDELTFAELAAIPDERRRNCIQIAEDTYLVPSALVDADYCNHSCSANAGIQGDRTLVAMRDIQPDEHITYDYCMSDSSSYDEFNCSCGSPDCRGKVSGTDWKREELQKKYAGYFSDYLLSRMRT